MMHKLIPALKRTIFPVLSLLSCTALGQINTGPYVASFEQTGALEGYHASSGSNLTIGDKHSKFGSKSLEWKWSRKGSSFSTASFSLLKKNMQPFAYEGIFARSPAFVFSVYSEHPQKGAVKVTFIKNRQPLVWFEFPVHFYGWRTAIVPFYEMMGQVPAKTASFEYDVIQISTSAANGALYFDDLVFSQYTDDRMPTPDFTVPFVKQDDPLTNHWTPRILYDEALQQLPVPVATISEKQDLEKVRQRIDADLLTGSGKSNFESVKRMFSRLNLSSAGNNIIKGPPLLHNAPVFYFDSLQQQPQNHNAIKTFGDAIKAVTRAYRSNVFDNEKRDELKKMFLLASRYFLDQGWQRGASGGNRNLIGYSTRELAEGFYLMEDVLGEAKLLSEIAGSLQWLNNIGKMVGQENEFIANLDFFNTQSYSCLLSVLLSADKNKQVALLKAYSNYLGVTLAQQDKEDGYKPDGTAWHHNGHYPAYAIGGFGVIARIIKTLSFTRFKVPEPGHQNFKTAFLASIAYSHLYSWGFGNGGRHPLEEESIAGLKNACLTLALSGTPDGKMATDRELAAACLRLWGSVDDVNATRFAGLGITPQKPVPYSVFPYSATAVQRYSNWAALIKGYSRYVWASEIYAESNRYGRYPANGSVELLNPGGEKASGLVQEGWDWNAYPGTTVIKLPLNQLESSLPLLMFRSQETFAGAATLNGLGVFGMILNESDGTNADGLIKTGRKGYSGGLKAIKSVFSFGDKIICVGSNITAVDPSNPVQTTLFQISIPPGGQPVRAQSGGMITNFPYEGHTGKWVIDGQGSGYYMLSGDVLLRNSRQQSLNNKFSLNDATRKGVKEADLPYTYGNFSTAFINHGLTPQNGSYQYVIYPFLSRDDQQQFQDKVVNDSSYAVIRADNVAHIVSYSPASATAYAIFNSNGFKGSGALSAVSAPCLLLIQQQHTGLLEVGVVQPDLNFRPTTKKKSGFENYSEPVELTLNFAGRWRVETPGVKITTTYTKETTVLTLTARHGFTKLLKLKKI